MNFNKTIETMEKKMIDHFEQTISQKEEDELFGAGLVIAMFFAWAVGFIVATGLWSQALALAIGFWLGKRHRR